MKSFQYIFNKIYIKFMDSKIMTKLLLGYIIVVLIPTASLSFLVYHLNYIYVKNRYIDNEQYSLETSKKNAVNQLKQVTDIIVFQNSNNSLKKYLSGDYDQLSDAIYTYISNIKPLTDYVNTNPYIKHSYIYSYSGNKIHEFNNLNNASAFPKDKHFTELIYNNIEGIWDICIEQDLPCLTYYQPIFSSTYGQRLGFTSAKIRISVILDNFSSSTNELYFSTPDKRINFKYYNNKITLLSSDKTPVYPRNSSIQTTYIDELELYVTQVIPSEHILNQRNPTLILIFTFLCLLLTGIYYIIISLTTRRIIKLNNHMKHSDADNLTQFTAEPYKDEIGSLIRSYNHMVKKINELIHQVYQDQLKRKDAEFYALQAQIKPHFLYNILENIRMRAEQNRDFMTADMIELLGNYMRYNLSKDTKNVPLLDELTHAKNYLNIQKIRLKSRLNITIEAYTELEHVKCPKFIIQPILENTLNHGLHPNKTTSISISIKDASQSHRPEDIKITISDNGTGMDSLQLKKIKSQLLEPSYEDDNHVGLININHRLQSLFGETYGLHIDSQLGGGTTVVFFLKQE